MLYAIIQIIHVLIERIYPCQSCSRWRRTWYWLSKKKKSRQWVKEDYLKEMSLWLFWRGFSASSGFSWSSSGSLKRRWHFGFKDVKIGSSVSVHVKSSGGYTSSLLTPIFWTTGTFARRAMPPPPPPLPPPLPSAAVNIHVLHWRRDCWHKARVHMEITQEPLNGRWWILAQALVVCQRMLITWPLVQPQYDPEIFVLHWKISNVSTSESKLWFPAKLQYICSMFPRYAGCSGASSRLSKWEEEMSCRALVYAGSFNILNNDSDSVTSFKALPSFSFDRVLKVSVSAIVWIHRNTLSMAEIQWMS